MTGDRQDRGPLYDGSADSPQELSIQYGRTVIRYSLVYEAREKLAISVLPDKSVEVRAPLGSGAEEIEQALIRRGKWIKRQIRYFDRFHPMQTPREYVSGETHLYLGRQYRLRVRQGAEEDVRLIGKFFIVRTRDPEDRAQVELLMKGWYADHAQLLIDRRAEEYAEKMLGEAFDRIETDYRYLRSEWGRSDPSGKLTFNIELVKAPVQCVDYVIVHELCHQVYPNHDKDFYRLLGRILPGWEERKERLEVFGGRMV